MAKLLDMPTLSSVASSSFFWTVTDNTDKKIAYSDLIQSISRDVYFDITNLSVNSEIADSSYIYLVSSGTPQKMLFQDFKNQILLGYSLNINNLPAVAAIPGDSEFVLNDVDGNVLSKTTFDQLKDRVIEDTYLDIQTLAELTSVGVSSIFYINDQSNNYKMTYDTLRTLLQNDIAFDVSVYSSLTSAGSGSLFYVREGATGYKMSYDDLKNQIISNVVTSIYEPFRYSAYTTTESRYNEDVSWVTLVSVPVTAGRMQSTRGIELDFGGKFKVSSGSAVTKTRIQLLMNNTTVFDGYTYAGLDPSLGDDGEPFYGTWFIQNKTENTQVHRGLLGFGTKDNLGDSFNTYTPVTLMDTTGAAVSSAMVSVGNSPYRDSFRIVYIGKLTSGDLARVKLSPDGTVWTFKDYATVGFYDEIQGPIRFIKVNKVGSGGEGKIVAMLPKAERSEIRITDSTPFNKVNTGVSTGSNISFKLQALLSANTSVRSKFMINSVYAEEKY